MSNEQCFILSILIVSTLKTEYGPIDNPLGKLY